MLRVASVPADAEPPQAVGERLIWWRRLQQQLAGGVEPQHVHHDRAAAVGARARFRIARADAKHRADALRTEAVRAWRDNAAPVDLEAHGAHVVVVLDVGRTTHVGRAVRVDGSGRAVRVGPLLQALVASG